MSARITADLVLGVLAGLMLGTLHLLWLRRDLLSFGRSAARPDVAASGTGALLAGAALRLALVVAGFAAVAWVATYPGFALIAALGGFLLARTVGLWRARRIRR